MIGLTIFIEIALAGCVFMLYFLYALWRDARNSRKGPRVEVRRLSSRREQTGKLLHMYSAEELWEQKRR